jgi:hypothetical protein
MTMRAAFEPISRLRAGLCFAGFGDLEAALFTERARFRSHERPVPGAAVPMPVVDQDRRRYLLT